VRDPHAPRQFKTPLVPLVPILGIAVNAAMIFGLGWPNWMRLGVWLVLGLGVYFGYGRRHSRLRAGAAGENRGSAELTAPSTS
jgi:APA family basic amino acid/polyamine antiporter